jgi:hypothetical protein
VPGSLARSARSVGAVATADDLEAAVAVASGCPSLTLGGGVEVGMIAEANQRPRLAAAD